jgi:hypothetical protein
LLTGKPPHDSLAVYHEYLSDIGIVHGLQCRQVENALGVSPFNFAG